MLIERARDHEVMFAYVIIAFIVIVGVLAYRAGVDSRIDENAHSRRFSG